MKKLFFQCIAFLLLPLLFSANTFAQSKGISVSNHKTLFYGAEKILNPSKKNKIKILELTDINQAFDKNAYHQGNTEYICEVNGWKTTDYKIDVLGVVHLDAGILYFYSVITPQKKYKICYGLRLVKGAQGSEKNYEYDVNEFFPDVYVRAVDNTFEAKLLEIEVESVGKKVVFVVNLKTKISSIKTTYTILPAESDNNAKWISTFTKSK
ncbi:MAG: hypothetical protein EAZ97_02310 [Bacteroidetes bacterium]|nr:MAG: hypothetical protein EAZ97_02310 [Bacteroidota bacterium]